MGSNDVHGLMVSNQTEMNSSEGDDQLLLCVSLPIEILILSFSYYAAVFCVGMFGNSFVIATIYQKQELQTPFNYLVINLAISDMCILLFSVPIVVFSECFSWLLGELACRFIRVFYSTCTGVSVGTMLLLSFERHRAVVTPLAPKMTAKKMKVSVALIWVFSCIIYGIPSYFTFDLEAFKGILLCDPVFKSLTVKLVIKIWFIVSILIAPCIAVCWAYSRVMRKLKDDLLVTGNAGTLRDVTKSRAQRNAKLMRLLFVLVLVFFSCFMPFNVLTFLNVLPAYRSWSYNETVENVSRMLQVTHSCLNPIILCVMSSHFREAFLALLKRCSALKCRVYRVYVLNDCP